MAYIIFVNPARRIFTGVGIVHYDEDRGHTAQVESLLTIEDLEKMPDDCLHRELVEGELIELPPPELIHNLISRRIFKLLDAVVAAHRLGIVLVERVSWSLQTAAHGFSPMYLSCRQVASI